MPMTAADLVADACRQIREISPHHVATQASGCILIDVREPAEFDTGHIAGAVNIPRGVLEFQVDAHPPSPTSATRRCRTRTSRSWSIAAPAAAQRWLR